MSINQLIPEHNPSERSHLYPVPAFSNLIGSFSRLKLTIRQVISPQIYVLGCDLSHWNATVDFKALKAAGYEFAILKATEQVGYSDPTFPARWRACLDADMLVGPYHFFRSNYSGADQADHHLNVIAPLLNATQGRIIPPAGDYETEDGVTVAVRKPRILDWHNTIRTALNVLPLAYTSQYLWQVLTGNMPFDCTGWGAHWTSSLSYLWPYGWPVTARKFMQFGVYPKHSWVPVVPGVTGEVDVNKFLGTLPELQALAGGPPPVDTWYTAVTTALRGQGYQIPDPPRRSII